MIMTKMSIPMSYNKTVLVGNLRVFFWFICLFGLGTNNNNPYDYAKKNAKIIQFKQKNFKFREMKKKTTNNKDDHRMNFELFFSSSEKLLNITNQKKKFIERN